MAVLIFLYHYLMNIIILNKTDGVKGMTEMYYEMFHRLKDIAGGSPEKLDGITYEMMYSLKSKEVDENAGDNRIYSRDGGAVCV